MPVPFNNTAYGFYLDMDPYVLSDLAYEMRQKPGISRINMPAWANNLAGGRGLAPMTDFSLQSLLDENQDIINRRLVNSNNIKSYLSENGAGVASAVAGAVGLVTDAVNEGKGNFTWDSLNAFNTGQNQSLADFNRRLGMANTTNDLLHYTDTLPDFVKEANKIRTKEYDFGKSLSAAGTGAAIGTSILPGIGTAIGAGAGWLINNIGQGIGILKDNRRKSSAQDYASKLADMSAGSILNAQNRVKNKTYKFGMANYLNNAAMGGPLSTHGSDFTDDLIRIDAGGSHESNPYGGVPAGLDPQGIPNLVEEGETIWDDYVFSKRLKAPKALVKKFALGGGKKGMSYSEAARKISEKSGAELRPNDPISKRTKDALLTELEDSQEEKRMAIQQRQLIKAMSEMSPEEFQAVLGGMQGTQPVEAMMSPQGMENTMGQEPLMQEPVGYEPQGLGVPGGFAFGGNILDGKHNTSWRRVSPLAGSQRIPGVGIIYDRDLGTQMPADMTGDAVITGNQITRHKTSTGRTYYMVNGERYQTLAGAQDAVIEARRAAENKRLDEAAKTFTPAVTVADSTEARIFKNAKERVTSEAQKAVQDALKAGEQYLTEKEAKDYVKKASRIGNMQKAGYSGFRQVDENGMPAGHSPWNFGDSAMRSAFLNRLNGGAYVDLTSPGAYFNEAVVVGKRTAPSKPPVETPKSDGSGSLGNSDGVATPDTAWTPNKIFSTSSISPVDVYRRNSVMFNAPAPRSAVQKAVEGLTDTDPENTVSVGAQQNKLLPTWMRYAPLIGGGISILSDLFSRPDYSEYENLIADSRRLSKPVSIPVETIGDRIRRNPFDERLMVNQANQNLAAGLRSTRDNAGGNRAYRQFANNLMAYNNQNQLSDIARTAYLANRQGDLQTADFDRGTSMFNAQSINQRNLTEGQLNAGKQYQGFMAGVNALNALENARRYDEQMTSADFTNFFQNLHNLGNENFAFNQQDALAREGLDRLRYFGRTGNMIFNPETGMFMVAKGGKIKTKKRRF